jgi:paraquat-inducible protein B
MLTQKTITEISKLLKMKPEDILTALKDEKEVDLELPADLTVLTTAELEARDTAQKNEGIKAGKEIGVKEVRTAAGLDETVGKDAAKVAAAIGAKFVTEAKIPADEKVKEVTKQNELLTQKLAEKDTELATEKQKASQYGIDRKIIAAMPKNRAAKFEDDEILDILKNKHIKEIDGQLVAVDKTGEPIRDKATTKPVDLATGLNTIFTEREWLAPAGAGGAGGRGGKDDSLKTLFTKKSEVIAHFAEKGISMNGEGSKEIVAKIAECAKDNQDFDMNN